MSVAKINSLSQEEFHKIFVEQTPNAISMLDKNMIYLAVSQRWLEDYKLNRDEVIGRSHYDIFPGITEEWKGNHKKCLQGAINCRDEFPYILADGSIKWIYWDVRPWRNAKGEIGGLLTHSGDVTHQRKKNLEIAQKLTNQNKQLADFTHITSHNLRAPVANLNSLLEIYNLSENEIDREDIFDKFETVIIHLTSTLNTLTEALITKTRDPSEDLEDVNLDYVLKNTTEILSGKILKSGAIIKSNFSKVSKIRYNRIYLESIFLNLVGNALKYKHEERVPEIYITTEVEDKKTILKFKDNGLGIDLERHGHKLFGLNKVFHRHPDAKGFGLFLTKTQIDVMGGDISATSKVNEGTTFTINFN
ncbi:PAS domain-containing sensor histidine kinase [Maribacter arcticus]|uniref:PAS domain-containing sensor histidine kinase n=1 Tax=Maribacter arcticus TaxID=561365 RepID=UPI003002A17A